MPNRFQSDVAGQRPCESPSGAGTVEEVEASPQHANERTDRLIHRPSQSSYVHEILRPQESAQLDANESLSGSIHNLTISDLAHDARFVLSPSSTLTESLSKDQALSPLRCEDISGGVYVIAQSSKEACFNLVSEHLSFRLFYDPASDNLVFVNMAEPTLLLKPMIDGEIDDIGWSLEIECSATLTPGPWKIRAGNGLDGNGDTAVDLGELLILRRRYCVQDFASLQETGSKRKIDTADGGQKKRHLDDDQSLVLIDMSPVVSSVHLSAHLKIAYIGTKERISKRSPHDYERRQSLAQHQARTDFGDSAVQHSRQEHAQFRSTTYCGKRN